MEPPSLVLEQLCSFLEALALGAVLGAGFDIYRALRLQGRRPVTVLSVVADCLFWIGAAALTIAVIMARRWGEIHLYTYLGLGAGFAGYIYFFSRLFLPVWVRFFGLIARCLARLYRLLVKICAVIAAPFLWVGRGVKRAGKYLSVMTGRISCGPRRKKE